MPTLFRDWFESRPIEVPARALAAGMSDSSWHNDAMPSLDFIAPTKSETDSTHLRLVLWVGDEWSKEDCGTRYAVDLSPCDEEGAWTEHTDSGRISLYHGDDLDAALEAAEKAVERLKAGALLSDFNPYEPAK